MVKQCIPVGFCFCSILPKYSHSYETQLNREPIKFSPWLIVWYSPQKYTTNVYSSRPKLFEHKVTDRYFWCFLNEETGNHFASVFLFNGLSSVLHISVCEMWKLQPNHNSIVPVNSLTDKVSVQIWGEFVFPTVTMN